MWRHQNVRAALAGVLAAACMTCRSPEASEPRITPGPYLLIATALPPTSPEDCSGHGTFVGVSIVTNVVLSREGGTWVAHPATVMDGDVEVRLDSSTTFFGTPALSGTAKGVLIDRRAERTLGRVSMVLDGRPPATTATLTGTFSTYADTMLSGQAEGEVAVSGSIGEGSCPFGYWTIRKPAPCEINDTIC